MQDSERTHRKWAAVEFEADASQEDLVGWLVSFCGATGCEIKPVGEASIRVVANYETPELSERDIERLKSSLEEYGLGGCLATLRQTSIAEEDWLAEWKKGFEPFPVGDRLIICPPWHRMELAEGAAAGRAVILLEPGMAFGTGLHATTRYCLRALDRFDVGKDVLDVGTGSGILAIGTALLYPDANIVAVDVDPVAVQVARQNLLLNGVDRRIRLLEGSTEILDDQSFDCILSNLTCEDIVALLLEYLRLLRPDGVVICAGILKEKLPRLEQALETYPLSIIDSEIDETWAGVTLSRIPVVVMPR